MQNEQQSGPGSVHEARQQQAQLLLKAGDLALQGQDAERVAQAARARADALAGDITALHREIMRLDGWIAGAESAQKAPEAPGEAAPVQTDESAPFGLT